MIKGSDRLTQQETFGGCVCGSNVACKVCDVNINTCMHLTLPKMHQSVDLPQIWLCTTKLSNTMTAAMTTLVK